MNLSMICKTCVLAAIMLPAHVFSANSLRFAETGIQDCPVMRSQAASGTLQSAEKALTGDFDWCYYWYDFGSGSLSDTWETSKYEYIADNGDGTVTISNFMAESLRPAGVADFKVADIKAEFDSDENALILAGNQYLYTLDVDGSPIEICLIGVRKNYAGSLQPDKDIDIVLRRDGMSYRLDTSKEAVAILIGACLPSGSYGGLGICQNCALHAWNGTMIYLVGTDNENEPIPYTCNVLAELRGNRLYLANYADCGYSRGVDFNIDFNSKTMTATNATLQSLTDLNGDPTELIAADMLSDGSAWKNDGSYKLSASFFVSGGATMIMQGSWAAYFMDQPVGIYTNTQTLLNFDISNPSSGIDIPACDTDKPDVFYNLQGIPVERPGRGIFISKHGNKIIR